MLLHLGADVVIEEGEVVGIFDLDNSSTSKRTRAFLADAQRKGEVINVSIGELPKSFVVCTVETTRGRGQRVYISPLTSATLLRRLEEGGLGSGRPGADRDEQRAGTGRPRP